MIGKRQLCEWVVVVEESNGRSAGATDAYDLASDSVLTLTRQYCSPDTGSVRTP